ncbi:MAG: 50S ribosomal protein L21 [Patescibacteria group bacterium]|nr:50S ribosomal protein L21 [Patescibacteria group bacterium]
MKYAVVKINGKQYQVCQGQSLLVDKINKNKGEELEFKEVYLLNEEGKITVGQPLVNGVTVKAVVEEQIKGDKVVVAKYKSKVRYRRKKGFRAKLTQIKITSIETGEKKAKEEPKVEKKVTKTAKKKTK